MILFAHIEVILDDLMCSLQLVLEVFDIEITGPEC